MCEIFQILNTSKSCLLFLNTLLMSKHIGRPEQPQGLVLRHLSWNPKASGAQSLLKFAQRPLVTVFQRLQTNVWLRASESPRENFSKPVVRNSDSMGPGVGSGKGLVFSPSSSNNPDVQPGVGNDDISGSSRWFLIVLES